jgi:hypothetical protein
MRGAHIHTVCLDLHQNVDDLRSLINLCSDARALILVARLDARAFILDDGLSAWPVARKKLRSETRVRVSKDSFARLKWRSSR